jgi:fatty acid synthase
LGELGLDSLMGVEIKQVIEQMFNTTMAMKEIQQLTFEKLRFMEKQLTGTTGTTMITNESSLPVVKTTTMTTTTTIGNASGKKYNYLMPSRVIEKLNQVEFITATTVPTMVAGGQQQPIPIVVIHPIEGHVNMLKTWAKHMKYPVFGVQYTEEAMQCDSIEQLADYYWQQIEKELLIHTPRVHLCGYSFGASVAFEMAARRANRISSLTLLDGSHSYVTAHVNTYKNKYNLENNGETEAEALFTFAQQYSPVLSRVQFINDLAQMMSFEQRVKYTVQQLLTKSQFQFEPIDLELATRSFVKKLFMSYKYQPKQLMRINEVLLIKSGQRSNLVQTSLGEDYGLSQVFNGKIKIQVVDGDHRSFLEGNNGFQVASILNEYLLCCY